MKIVIPGGSGQVGSMLARYFRAGGHDVAILRRPWQACDLAGADVCINLAGRSVNCRYNDRNRREILDSRVDTTKWLGKAIAAMPRPPRVWLNASTATIYRHSFDREMDEFSGEIGGPWSFSVGVAKAWESAFFSEEVAGVRKIAMRSAMTMSPDRGGIFDVMSGLVRRGLGGTLGSGRQYVSWIHEADFTRAVDFLICREDISGCVNLASPNPLPNADFMLALRRAWGVPFGLPATAWMLELGAVFMRTETELVLKSRRAVPGRLIDSGFEFRHPSWPEAASDLVRLMREGAARSSL